MVRSCGTRDLAPDDARTRDGSPLTFRPGANGGPTASCSRGLERRDDALALDLLEIADRCAGSTAIARSSDAQGFQPGTRNGRHDR